MKRVQARSPSVRRTSRMRALRQSELSTAAAARPPSPPSPRIAWWYSAITRWAGPSASRCPPESQIARVQIASTALEAWLTNTIVPPPRWNSTIRAMHFCWKAASPTARISSSSSTSGCSADETAKPSRASIPVE
jgi:hypothetical protein